MAKRASKSTHGRSPESVKESLLLVESGQQGAPLSKRADRADFEFTTYIRETAHLAVTVRLVSKGKGSERSRPGTHYELAYGERIL